jgi:hypothetical protein
MDVDVILQCFNNRTSEQDEDSKLGQHGNGNSWRELRKIFDAAVADKAKVEAQRLKASLHSLQTQNELLHHENNGLTRALKAKNKHKTKSKTMDLQQCKEYHGGAVFWSPRKLREARARNAVKQDEAKQQQFQKTQDRELKAAATLYKKEQAEAAKVAQQHATEERCKAKKERADELAAAWTLKKQQCDAATAQKSHDTPTGRKQKASHKAVKIPAKRCRVVGSRTGVAPAPAALPAPPKATRMRSVKPPQRYSE